MYVYSSPHNDGGAYKRYVGNESGHSACMEACEMGGRWSYDRTFEGCLREHATAVDKAKGGHALSWMMPGGPEACWGDRQ